MPNKNLLFVMLRLPRQFIYLAKKFSRLGFNVYIASPTGNTATLLHKENFIRLYKFKNHLFGKKFIKDFNGKVIAFDEASDKFLTKAEINHKNYFETLGVDLSVWNPESISGNKQTLLLSKYNIAPHQKLLLALGPKESDIKSMILETKGLEKEDFVIAIYGSFTKFIAKRINKLLKTAGKIVYIGSEPDLPSLMRASFGILSFDKDSSFYKVSSLAMGRTTVWEKDFIKPNIIMDQRLNETIKMIINLPISSQKKFESENIKAAAKYNIENNVFDIQNMIK